MIKVRYIKTFITIEKISIQKMLSQKVFSVVKKGEAIVEEDI